MSRTSDILDFIVKNPGTTTTAAAKALDIPPSTVAVFMASLKARGYATRVELPGKRTQYAYTATAKAAEFKEHGRTPRPSRQVEPAAPAPKVLPWPEEPAVEVAIKTRFDELLESMADELVLQLIAKVNLKLPQALAEAQVPQPQVLAQATTATPSTTIDQSAYVPILRPRGQSDDGQTRRPRWLIAGLMSAQFARVTQEFEEKVDFSYWKEGSTKDLAAKARGADRVFVHVRHFGHSQQAIVKANKDATRITLVNGGESEMKRMLAIHLNELKEIQ